MGSNNRHKLNQKIAKIHQTVSDTIKDFHYKLAHCLCDDNGMIFVEDINFRAWSRNMLCKHNLDAGFGQFFEILSYVCWKRDVYFAKVNKNYTSQICPNCEVHTGKKQLSERTHRKTRDAGNSASLDLSREATRAVLTAVGFMV